MTIEVKTTLIPQISIMDGKAALLHLIQLEGHNPQVISGADLQALAERLTKYAPVTGRKAKWGKDYLDNVIKGRLEPSGALAQAVFAMLQSKRGTPKAWAVARPVLLSVVGNVKPGALVSVDSRDCKNPACARPFIPVNYFQRYCTPECRPEKKRTNAAQNTNGKHREG